MKKWGFLLAALVFLSLALLRVSETSSPEAEAPAPSLRARLAQKPAAAPAPTPKPKTISVRPRPKVESDQEVVPFEMKEGYAVAHGDIILGVPEDASVEKGHYKMPSPDYWETAEIPYVINNDVVNPGRILKALKHIEAKAGLHFVPYEEGDGILFQAGEQHCLSALGRQGGLQPIKLSGRCGWNEITHEVLHALGFIHEQSRVDRDQAIEVIWENIEQKYQSQFTLLPESFLGPARGTVFDYRSIMLYAPGTFAKEKGYLTMKSRSPSPIAPSQEGLSPGDVERLRALFRL